MKENGKTDGIDEEECIADYYLPYFSDWLHNVFFLHVLGFVLQQSAQSNSAEILEHLIQEIGEFWMKNHSARMIMCP